MSYDSAAVEGDGGTPPALNSATGVRDGAYDVDVVAVKSCFNGLAIYKGDTFYTALCSYADATAVRPHPPKPHTHAIALNKWYTGGLH
jgi:hypothetical protein